MTKHWFGANSAGSKGKGHPIMYGKPKPAKHFDDFPDGGGYPIGFVEWAYEQMGITGIRVDIREETNPTVCCDARHTPFPDGSFDFILSDPPYAESYAENLYGTGSSYPKPGELLKEATRLLRPGGYFGILHFIVPMNKKPMKMINVWGVTTGAGYAIRAWSLFQKASPPLFLDPAPAATQPELA
jgi:SAM-dependent methyltransferase